MTAADTFDRLFEPRLWPLIHKREFFPTSKVCLAEWRGLGFRERDYHELSRDMVRRFLDESHGSVRSAA